MNVWDSSDGTRLEHKRAEVLKWSQKGGRAPESKRHLDVISPEATLSSHFFSPARKPRL